MTSEPKGWGPSLAALLSGLLFGVGLGVSGMTLPAKVIGFLDVAGDWDASLAFVMVGAIAVHAVLYRLVRRRPVPLFDGTFHVPTRRDLDARLVVGAALFGVGWGLGGFCPGPALVSLGSGSGAAVLFVAAMLVGMLLQHATNAATTAAPKPKPPEPPAETQPSPGE
jgi:uncharacterized membrane protein YedE/YeeE